MVLRIGIIALHDAIILGVGDGCVLFEGGKRGVYDLERESVKTGM